MKTTFKIIGIIIILIIALIIALPFIFRGKITEFAKEEINKNLNAEVNFNRITLSLFKNFPDFTLGIKDLSVSGKGQFQGDTLAGIPSLDITVDLMSVISGSDYEVKKIKITSPTLLIKILEDGSTNYDIVPVEDTTAESIPAQDTAGGEFNLRLQRVEITDATITYSDIPSEIELMMRGMDFGLSGDLTADQTILKTSMEIREMDLRYAGIPYFTKSNVSYTADINADLNNEIYVLDKNSLRLNELYLEFDGSVAMEGDDINTELSFLTPKTDFKAFLSLIPAIYSQDFAGLQASGKLGINGNIKGIYNETTLPAFHVHLEIQDGLFQYPGLPQSVNDVNLDGTIANPGGDADNTVIDLTKFHLQMGVNPVDLQILVKTPVSDPDIKATINGKIDLATIGDFYPLEAGEELSGNLTADITLQGKLSAIENEDYESFIATGSLLMQNLIYTNSYTGDPVEIADARLNFSPQFLELATFVCTIGENDISATGKISNYLAYTFKNELLTGSITTRSDFIDLNSLMPEEGTVEPTDTAASEASAMSVIEVPGNIDFQLNSTFRRLVYDTYDMENVNGKLSIRDRKLIIDNLSMNILDGEMVISGTYSTAEPEKPAFDFNLDIRNIDIQKAYSTFGVMSKYAPIASKTKGKFSSSLVMRSQLDQAMMPVYETMTGGGKLQTTALSIQDINTLDKIADALKYEPLKNLSIDKILLQFEFVDGKILIEPFDIRQNGFSGKMAGWTGLDQVINYTLNLNIPRESFGKEANNVLNGLVSQANSKGANFSLGETVSMDVLIGGTLTNPEIKTSLKETGKNLVEDVKKQVEEEIQKQKEELGQKAQEEAQKILDEADKQAAMLNAEAQKQAQNLRKNAADGAKKVREEGEKQAKNIEAEGKKKGFIAEAAAKESAKQVRKEAEKQAKNIEDEAEKQARAITDKANQESALIKQNARKEADKVLGKI